MEAPILTAKVEQWVFALFVSSSSHFSDQNDVISLFNLIDAFTLKTSERAGDDRDIF